eukprot:TRINITY_DN55456_c0_g1_i1.p1 TRINITY_DN55456_c0_g1~~TRINITY_DN55456_c0_g1_i1.p1  ORF type:complete len:253 (+),score=34.39 TRINITY_DN55456_c0_g1_i1:228-986(+)
MAGEQPHPSRGTYGERRLRSFTNPGARAFKEDVGREMAARLGQEVACRPVAPERRYLEMTLADTVRSSIGAKRSTLASESVDDIQGGTQAWANADRRDLSEPRPATGTSVAPSLPRRTRKDIVYGQWDLELMPTRTKSPPPCTGTAADLLTRADSAPVTQKDWRVNPQLSLQSLPARAPASPAASRRSVSGTSSCYTRRSSAPAHRHQDLGKELLRTPVLMALFYPEEATNLSCNKYAQECQTEPKYHGFWR